MRKTVLLGTTGTPSGRPPWATTRVAQREDLRYNRRMSRQHIIGLSSVLLLGAAIPSRGPAQGRADFAGTWVLQLGNRVLMVLTLTPSAEVGGQFTGTLVCPRHYSYSTSAGGYFSDISGPTVHYPIVRSSTKDNCLSFTTQHPTDKRDEDQFQLCIGGDGRGSLKIDAPAFEGWPVTRETGPSQVTTDWESTRNYFLGDTGVSNPEMKQIFDEDQKDRQPGVGKIDWGVVDKADAARREATRKLLSKGKLHTGEDFERAAFVFQHGDAPDDYLLAHTLAMVAVARGRSGALWIEAATLDRYLGSIHQPQIYGTQFYFKQNEPTTQEPYNRTLIPDVLRLNLGVPSQAGQEEQRKRYEAERFKP